MTYHYKKACAHYRLVLLPQTFKQLDTRSTCRYRCIWYILTVGAYFLALVNSICIHISGRTFSISEKPWSTAHFPTSTASAGLPVPFSWCPCRFRAVSCHVWLLPHVNIFHTSQLLVSLGGLTYITIYTCMNKTN